MCHVVLMMLFLFFKQKTAYEMRISDWSSDVCSSDLLAPDQAASLNFAVGRYGVGLTARNSERSSNDPCFHWLQPRGTRGVERGRAQHQSRSEEHTSELQSLMRISYAVFCLKKKKNNNNNIIKNTHTTFVDNHPRK